MADEDIGFTIVFLIFAAGAACFLYWWCKREKQIDLLITINDLHQPIFTLNFFSSIITAEQDLQLAKQWKGMFDVIIHQNRQRQMG